MRSIIGSIFLLLACLSVFSQSADKTKGCAPLTVNFTGAAGLWDYDDGSMESSSDPIHTFTAPGVYNVTYEGTLVSKITVYEVPIVNAGPDQKICKNEIAKLNGTVTKGKTPYTYSWTPSDSLVGVTNVLNPNVKGIAKTTVFTLVVTDANSCSASSTVKLTLNPIVAMAGQTVDVCNAFAFTPSYSVVGGHGSASTFKYLWTPSTDILNSTSSKPIFKPNNTTTSAQIYTTLFTVTDSVGCSSSSLFSYKVRPRLKFDNYTDKQICLGTWSSSSGNVSNGEGDPSTYIYSWTPTTNLSNNFIANPSFKGVGSTLYKLKVIDGYNCMDSTTMTVSIFTPINISAGSTKTVCYNTPLKLNGLVSAGVAPTTYYWSPKEMVVDSTLLTTETQPLLSTAYVYLNATDSKGCYRKDSILVTVDIPTPSIAANPNVCVNDPQKLNASATGGISPYKYIWKLVSSSGKLADGDGLNDSDVNDSIAQVRFLPVEQAGTVVYDLVVKDKLGCFSPKKAYDTLYVRPLPTFSKKNDYIFCFEDVNVMTLIADSGYVSYKWSTGANTRTTQISAQGTFVYWATDSYGCKLSDTIQVVTKCTPRIYVPDAFSPNADGVNDVFQFYGRYYTNASMKIFNRLGELIYILNNEAPTWDGMVSGKLVAPGSYPYILEYSGVINNDVYHKQGVINVIR